jgi:hypothetical protein
MLEKIGTMLLYFRHDGKMLNRSQSYINLFNLSGKLKEISTHKFLHQIISILTDFDKQNLKQVYHYALMNNCYGNLFLA